MVVTALWRSFLGNMKPLLTISAILAISALATYDQLKPATIDDTVQEAEWENKLECGNVVEEDYLSFCNYGQVFVVTAKELKELGSATQVEQKLSELYGGSFEIKFDFNKGKFIKEEGGYERHNQ